jgi:hypothetical protein
MQRLAGDVVEYRLQFLSTNGQGEFTAEGLTPGKYGVSLMSELNGAMRTKTPPLTLSTQMSRASLFDSLRAHQFPALSYWRLTTNGIRELNPTAEFKPTCSRHLDS